MDKRPPQQPEPHALDDFPYLARVRVAGSNSVVRSKKVLVRWGAIVAHDAEASRMRIRMRILGFLPI